jgi:putative transposase
VPPHHTGRTGPCCGQVAKESRKTQARFLCSACGCAIHADVVGAINILARGMKTLEGPDLARIAGGDASPRQ